MGRRLVLAVLLVLAPMALLAYGLTRNPRAVPSALVGSPAPAFALPLLTPETADAVRLDALRGQVVVVNFWASWCGPCREEAAALEAVWRRYEPAGVRFVGVNVHDQRSAALAFLQETRPSYANVVDATGATGIAYGIYGLPETFVIDRQGRIQARLVGAVSGPGLASRLDAVLGGRS